MFVLDMVIASVLVVLILFIDSLVIVIVFLSVS